MNMHRGWWVAALALACAGNVSAQEGWSEQLSAAVKGGTVELDLRYRFEWVDQDGFDDEAEASLLRSRITLKSAPLYGFTALLEADDVTNIGPNDYNSTENGKTEFPVVADPEYTEINQAWLAYGNEAVTATGGRLRVNHLNQRFVGGVAWRQNEQTFDGGRVEWKPLDGLLLDATYAYNVNRIFGPDDGANPADLEGDTILLLANYDIAEGHRISGFGYLLDFDEQDDFAAGKTVNLSSDTYGVEYQGRFGMVDLRASYATQSDAGDSELDYDAAYYLAEVGVTVEGIKLQFAWEVLESDNGVGFATPLATAHAFQGWADLFLTTPTDGIEDANVSIGGKIGPVNVKAIYHDFQAEASSDDFGTELNLIATWPVNKQFTVQAKYASFDTDVQERFPDTDRAWLTLQLKL
ncbi:MAG: alginate export family protein [Halieaceae bacterium]|jgi:hypothetical protein|nr:alginate export family protein [Halieaceae bacterium]